MLSNFVFFIKNIIHVLAMILVNVGKKITKICQSQITTVNSHQQILIS